MLTQGWELVCLGTYIGWAGGGGVPIMIGKTHVIQNEPVSESVRINCPRGFFGRAERDKTSRDAC